MRRTLTILAAVALVILPAGAAAQDHQHDDKVGTVTFPVACNAEAQTRMNSAVAMLHSFWFPEARKTFETVVQADPGCGIAYWGVALTHFGNAIAYGGPPASQAAGWEAVQKATSAGARNDRDRAYINAAATLFRDYDKVDNRTRMQAYERAMKGVVDPFSAGRIGPASAAHFDGPSGANDSDEARVKEATALGTQNEDETNVSVARQTKLLRCHVESDPVALFRARDLAVVRGHYASLGLGSRGC